MIDVEQARHLYAAGDAAHGFDHILRVWHLCQRIGQAEGADLIILQVAALLHDVARGRQGDDDCHAEASAIAAQDLLAGAPAAYVDRVAQAIREHRYRSGPAPSSLEAQVLFDADKLDAIGAIGIARAFAYGGAHGQRLTPETWDENEAIDLASHPEITGDEHTPVHEYRLKLVHIGEHLYTETGKSIAKNRLAFMTAFFRRLQDETEGLC